LLKCFFCRKINSPGVYFVFKSGNDVIFEIGTLSLIIAIVASSHQDIAGVKRPLGFNCNKYVERAVNF